LTYAKYLLVERDEFEQLKRAVDYDASEPDPRAFYPCFAAAVRDDVAAPGMAVCDADLPSRD
jgi:hypothetical protein